MIQKYQTANGAATAAVVGRALDAIADELRTVAAYAGSGQLTPGQRNKLRSTVGAVREALAKLEAAR